MVDATGQSGVSFTRSSRVTFSTIIPTRPMSRSLVIFGMQYILSGAFAHYSKAHIRVDVVYQALSARNKAGMDALAPALLFFLYMGVMTYTGWFLLGFSEMWEVSFTTGFTSLSGEVPGVPRFAAAPAAGWRDFIRASILLPRERVYMSIEWIPC